MAYTGYLAGQGGPYTLGGASTSNFIPELWSDAFYIRERDKNLVMAQNVKMIDFRGVKGDTMYIPRITGAFVTEKVAEAPITFQVHNDSTYSIQVDRHRVSPFSVEDITRVQSSVDHLQEYSERHAYQMALDNDLFLLSARADIAGLASQNIYVTDNSLSTGTYEPMSEAAVLAAKEALDDARVPDEGRFAVISSKQYNALLAIDAFRNSNYIGGQPVVTGEIPNTIYGFRFIKSTALRLNTDTAHLVNSAGNQQASDAFSAGYSSSSTWWPTQNVNTLTGLGTLNDDGETAIFGHPDYLALAMQRDVRVQSDYELSYLATHVVYDYIFGFKVYREDHAVLVHTAA